MRFCLLLIVAIAISSPAGAAIKFRTSSVKGYFAKPAEGGFLPDTLKNLQLPKNFHIAVFAKNLGDPRMMVQTADGRVLVSRPKKGDILALKDTNGDGVADEQKTIVSGFHRPHGMALHEGKLYFVATTQIFEASPEPAASTKLLIDHLPSVGQHQNRSIAIGPDGLLYVAIASSCNTCDDPTENIATMLRFKLDGSAKEEFARGLRDTIGFDWEPTSHELYGVDHGVDWRGDDRPREELNLIQFGKNYGWPFCVENKIPDENLTDDPEGSTKEDYCKNTVAPLLLLDAHSAPIAMKFYTGTMFPAEYKNSAFVALHGSWNTSRPVGYEVKRVVFKDGKPEKFENFLSGFLDKSKKTEHGRPAGLLVMADGSLLVSDDSGGVIYRITYKK